MHEFGPGDFFDWHVDTTPGDGAAARSNRNRNRNPNSNPDP